MLRSVFWNLLLAAIPVALGAVLAWGAAGKRRRLPLPVLWLLGAAWLVFVPNTCYLFTEWRHLLFDPRWEWMLDAGHSDRQAMLLTAQWSLMFLGYSGVGALLFVLAMRPVERCLRAARQPFLLYAPPLFFLISLGVYLGLIMRLNSWDALQRPELVLRRTVDALSNPTLLATIGVFALILWGVYEALDLWCDAVVERVGRGARVTRREAK